MRLAFELMMSAIIRDILFTKLSNFTRYRISYLIQHQCVTCVLIIFLVLTAIKTFADPISVFTNKFPRGLFTHDRRDTSERDLSSMRVPFNAQSAVDLSPVSIYESALDPLEKFRIIMTKVMITMIKIYYN